MLTNPMRRRMLTNPHQCEERKGKGMRCGVNEMKSACAMSNKKELWSKVIDNMCVVFGIEGISATMHA